MNYCRTVYKVAFEDSLLTAKKHFINAIGLKSIEQIISGKMISKASFDSTFNGFGDKRQVRDRTIVEQILFVKTAGFFPSKGDIVEFFKEGWSLPLAVAQAFKNTL